MVPRITYPERLSNALNYHEQKVQKGKAECLYAQNFLLDHSSMNFHDKLNRFKQQMDLNTTSDYKLMHVSLNFEPSERIERQNLIDIANKYMERIGFGDQPYLVYEHSDAGHPHLHILTTTIDSAGELIDTFNIGRNQSAKARDELEKEYGLIQAKGRGAQQQQLDFPALAFDPVEYGKSETKRKITNLLDVVVNRYAFTSLHEYNAILQVGNVVADRGDPASRMYQQRGLVYRVLKDGQKVGVPIKASSIYSKPTLDRIEGKYLANKMRKEICADQVRTLVNACRQRTGNIYDLVNELSTKGVATILRQNSLGYVYGITFIDHNTKTVFNGSDLDKTLSIAGILKSFEQRASRLAKPVEILIPTPPLKTANTASFASFSRTTTTNSPDQDRELDKRIDKKVNLTFHNINRLLLNTIKPDKNYNPTPYQLKRKKKKRKKPNW